MSSGLFRIVTTAQFRVRHCARGLEKASKMRHMNFRVELIQPSVPESRGRWRSRDGMTNV